MLSFGNFNWVFLWNYIVHVFGIIFSYIWRFSDEKFVENGSLLNHLCEKPEVNIGENGEKIDSDQQVEAREIPKLENEVGNVSSASTSKYQFSAGNSVCAFVEKPQTMNFIVQEMFVISHDESPLRQESLEKDESSTEVDFRGFSVDLDDITLSNDPKIDSCILEHDGGGELSEEEELVKQSKTECSVSGHSFEDQGVSCDQDENFKKEEIVGQNHIDEVCSSISNSDDFWATIHRYDGLLSSNDRFDCYFDEMLYDKSCVEALEPETPIGIDDIRVDYDQESPSSIDDYLINNKFSEVDDLNNIEIELKGVGDIGMDYGQDCPRSVDDFLINQNNSELDDLHIEVEHDSAESLYIELEPQSYCSTKHIENHQDKGGFSDSEENEIDEETLKFDELKDLDDSENLEEDDQLGGDVLLEQRELIRQMKKEMRQLKISGLPTILEESESPRVEEDLRPLKIDEKIGHKDRMDEIQTFYRRYMDKMRKLDILSQQTMYAIGLLQLKSQDLALNKKVSVPVIKSLLAQNFWSNKLRKHETDPVQQLIRDLRRDLELVYVGQLCLSWEMLKWQHHKAEELQAHDPDVFRQHNQVAGEFQKFQVLLQRFTEDEPFHQGPRVQHYVKSRCGLPALLQVPLVKDDPKTEWRRNGEDGISVKMLKEVIGASMRAFWDFLHADKEEVHTISLIGIYGVQVVLQDPSDTDLLTEIRSSLQKKEKRLKDLVRSGNCLVKKFKKHQDQRLSHEMLIAQVELRLVSRVLGMLKLTTDQLLWCHKKLNKIDIIGRKIYLEYSFLLFPC